MCKQREQVLPATRNFEILELIENFVRFDGGQYDHERIFFNFSNPEMIRVLESSNFWLAHGTFKGTPKIFSEFYSVLVSLSEITPACIYAFLPIKTEKTYHRFLEALKNLTRTVNLKNFCWISSRPLLKRFEKTFQSCLDVLFILSHNYMRKVEELGLTKEYETTNQLASLQTLSLLNDSSGHQFTKKKKDTESETKKCRILCTFTKRTDLHSFRAMAKHLFICSLYIFQSKIFFFVMTRI